MSTPTTDDEVNDTKCTPSFFNVFNIGVTEKCKEYNAKKKADKDAADKAKRELTNVTPVETTNLPPADASNNEVKKPPASNESDDSNASGKPADPPTKMGGWFSRGGKRKSKAKKSRRKNRKQRKSRKSRK